jgi:hypothetical protein
MARTVRIAGAILLLCLLDAGAPAAATPTISIERPADGAVFTRSDVEFNGTTGGSFWNWTQTTKADFDVGTRDKVVTDATGTIRLAGNVTDDFNDGMIDSDRWDIATYMKGGISASESDGVLHVSGTDKNSGVWEGGCSPLTREEVSDDLSADLVSFGGSGSGYDSMLTLFQDGANYVLIGKIHDQGAFGSGVYTYIHCSRGGKQTFFTTGAAPSGSVNYRITYANQTASLYQDDALAATEDIRLENPRLMLMNLVRSQGDSLSSQWDNVRTKYHRNGTFLSSVLDSRADAPELRAVRWNAQALYGTSVEFSIRSASGTGMAGATDWTPLASVQAADLPGSRRFIQYRVTLASEAGLRTPVFEDMNLTYLLPCVSVELGDGTAWDWGSANGTGDWSSIAHLPDGNLTVWARATDGAGDTCITMVRVNVDTLPPVGSIIIDKGMEHTRSTRVSLGIWADDLSGVAAMMLSDSADFPDATWRPYARTVTWMLAPGDGMRTVYVRFRDALGWESEAVNDSIILDTSVPAGTVLINGGAEFCNDPNVTLTLNATDPNGVAEMALSNDHDLPGTVWIPYREACCWTLVPGNDRRTVYARFRDIAGTVSTVSEDSILLDTTPPLVELVIDGGATYTRARNVTVELNLTENFWALDMELNPGGPYPGAGWQDMDSVFTYMLPQGDGEKTIRARARDAAGNVGPPADDDIILDTIAPVSAVRPLPATMLSENFSVGWEGNDSTSGIRWYDVQYRDDDGPWTDWLLQTCQTGADFIGLDWHCYSFRVRALDRAGNQEQYPGTAWPCTRVGRAVPPLVSIDQPASNTTVRGMSMVRGTSTHPDPLRSVSLVEVRFDEQKTWVAANGTTVWEFSVDTGSMKDGRHVVHARAFDGERHSIEANRTFFVRLRSTQTRVDYFPCLLGLLFVTLSAGYLTFRYYRYQRALDEAPAGGPDVGDAGVSGAGIPPDTYEDGPPRGMV